MEMLVIQCSKANISHSWHHESQLSYKTLGRDHASFQRRNAIEMCLAPGRWPPNIQARQQRPSFKRTILRSWSDKLSLLSLIWQKIWGVILKCCWTKTFNCYWIVESGGVSMKEYLSVEKCQTLVNSIINTYFIIY